MLDVRFVLFSMDKEIVYINNILLTSEEGLTTSEISKELYINYQIKVSRTIVKNYLWSYFRNIIKYDSSNYTYTLDNDVFLIDDVVVMATEKSPRAISFEFKGPKIHIVYNRDKSIEEYIKAFAILNFKPTTKTKNADIIKLINRIIEQTETLND